MTQLRTTPGDMVHEPDDTVVEAMRRAIALSQQGPASDPNPQVGCVLLSSDGTILAEGWHRGAGTPHAEIAALHALARPEDARGATAVVTLEPCNHHGRTGPCSHALADAGVARVVYGVSDQGALSSGGGDYLRSRGIDVVDGLLADEVAHSIAGWLERVGQRRPYITVKWAQSLDGRSAANDGSSQWITGPDARADVHRRRARAEAIVAGTGTILADDPALTARQADGTLLDRQPLPIVLGTTSIPTTSAIHQHPRTPRFFNTRDIRAVCTTLFDEGVNSLFIEGGPTLASAFLREGLVDEVVVYVAPLLLGGSRVSVGDLGVDTLAHGVRLRIDHVDQLGPDLCVVAHPVRLSTREEN